jgi:hypothetical protein
MLIENGASRGGVGERPGVASGGFAGAVAGGGRRLVRKRRSGEARAGEWPRGL